MNKITTVKHMSKYGIKSIRPATWSIPMFGKSNNKSNLIITLIF